MKQVALLLSLGLAGAGLQAASEAPAQAPAAPSAPASAAAPQAPAVLAPAVAAQAASSPTAGAAVAPALPEPVSGSAELAPPPAASPVSPNAAISDEIMVPEEVEDPMQMAAEAPITDLRPISSTVLAKLANALTNDASELYFDAEQGEVLKDSAAGAWRVDATALYAELAHRLAYAEDKDALQALNFADLRRDERAKEARELAYEDKLADATIALLEAGKPKAKAELERLAAKGNRRARQYLGLDKLPEAVGPVAASPTAAVLSPTAMPLTPAAAPLSPAAAVAPVAPEATTSTPASDAKPAPAKVARP